MDEGFPLPNYDVTSHLKWMDQAGVQTAVLTLAAPQPTAAHVVRQANEAAASIWGASIQGGSCSVQHCPYPMSVRPTVLPSGPSMPSTR